MDADSVLAAVQDPEAAEELRKLMEDPEAMREAKEMMDDPDFRAQMMETLAGSNKLEEIRSALTGDSALTASLKQLGPSMGAALDVLKYSTPSADEFNEACKALEGLSQRLATLEAKYRRLRLSNEALQQRLLRFPGGRRCLEAIGFTQELDVDGEAHLEHHGNGLDDETTAAATIGHLLEKVKTAREDVARAEQMNQQHGIAYRIALEMPKIRHLIAGEREMGQLLTHVLMENVEFRGHTTGQVAELALPSILQLLRTKQGVQGLIEYYTGAPLGETHVIRVATVSEWKDALVNAGARPVCAFFSSSADVASRLLSPAFARLADKSEEAGTEGETSGEGASAFSSVVFLQVTLDVNKDDGLVSAVFDEAYVSPRAVPTFVYLGECLEHTKWRYGGSDIGEVSKRLKRIVSNDRLDDGPDAEDEES